MDLPSTRELELELLLRERDTQLAELTDEISTLRHYIAKQPGPSTTEPVSLPPPLLAIILPHLNNGALDSATGSSTVTAALTQRTRVLQEENDELYDLLKRSETGRLMEEVTAQQRIISRLETALKESHTVIKSLSTELDKAYETITSLSRPAPSRDYNRRPASRSRSPNNSYQPTAPQLESANSNGKQLPTGPRAHKKPRISEPNQPSPQPRPIPSLPYKPQPSQHSHGGHGHGSHGGTHGHGHNIPNIPPRPDLRVDQSRGHSHDSRKGGTSQGGGTRMDVDNNDSQSHQKRPLSPNRKERETRRDRDKPMKDRVREHLAGGSQGAGVDGGHGGGIGGGFKERERDRDRPPRDNHRQPNNARRNNGNFSNASGRGGGVTSGGGGGGGGAHNGPGRRMNDNRGYIAGSNNAPSDRTLQERLGL
ncbi:hypothetical protein CVT24_003612 [Panaeolus cyanescens]|uniref:Uncharacterized protein n=1 Tax=Panaeolus cyanescens TaxID=181874 RepID=A0A409Y7J3_9AGAR|nr:hypothetical protein CVT24_003612 [Panaeolus cyanescens]